MDNIVFIIILVFSLSIVFSMFGVGGGLVYVPLFIYFHGFRSEVFMLSFMCVFVLSLSAVIVYQRARVIEWRLVFYLGGPLAIMMFSTGFLIDYISINFIKLMLGLTLITAGIILIRPIKDIDIPNFLFQKLNKILPDRKYKISPVFMSPITFIVGFFAGISGVAAGIFDTPIMIILLFVFLGSQIGPKISLKINKYIFKKICGGFIIPAGIFYVIKAIV